MNNFAYIDFRQHALQMQIFIDDEWHVVVRCDRTDTCKGTKEYCLDAIRNYMVFFDGDGKYVSVSIYDRTVGHGGGDEGVQFFKSKLTQMASSCRAQMRVEVCRNWQMA